VLIKRENIASEQGCSTWPTMQRMDEGRIGKALRPALAMAAE
jgi:hypothetical protein